MPVASYQDLQVWQLAMDLAVLCYQHTKAFPKSEVFGLTSQIRRAAQSIPANIAEGQGREHTKEFLHSLSIANGSLKELETHIILSQRVGLFPGEESQELLALTLRVGQMLTALRKALQRNCSQDSSRS
jgi:four helix bundle protein